MVVRWAHNPEVVGSNPALASILFIKIKNSKCQENVKNLLTRQKLDISIGFAMKKLDISIGFENGQKMSVGKLVRHKRVPMLGLGIVVGESKKHKGYWIVQWCDVRYHDVGQLGIDKDYLQIV